MVGPGLAGFGTIQLVDAVTGSPQVTGRFKGQLPANRKAEETLQALDAEIERIRTQRVTDTEVARALKQARANFTYGSESITNQAFWLGHAEMFATYDWFLTYLDKLGRVTPEQVQAAAQQYLRPQNRLVGTYLPAEAAK